MDIRQTYVTNDEIYLYLFLRISPSPRQRNEGNASTGSIGDLYLDTDNDSRTGCRDVIGWDYGKINGYEFKSSFSLGVFQRGEESGWFVSCTVTKVDPNHGRFVFDRAFEAGSHEPESLIAEGPDGVEVAIPLSALNVNPGDTLRLLMHEKTHGFSDKELFSEGSYTVSP